jgi:hypothetical protein
MALPRYPHLKKKLAKMLMDYFEAEARKELGPLQDVRRFTQHEGKILTHNTMDSSHKNKELKYVEFKSEYKVAYADVPTMGAEGVLKLLQEQAKEFGAQQAKHQYKVISQTSQEVGNVVNNGGNPFSIDSFFEVMEKIQIEFDEFGKPNMPTMVVSPEGAERAKEVIKQAENDPEVKKRMDELLAKKKKAYDAEQARRKLVD